MIHRGEHVKFACGDWVYDRIDPRHIGQIRAITNSVFATIEWRKNLESELPLRHLVKVAHGDVVGNSD